jgi:hypothetical protein
MERGALAAARLQGPVEVNVNRGLCYQSFTHSLR